MNNILLIAKFLVKRFKWKYYFRTYFKKSLDGLVFKDLKAQKLILDYFNIKEIKNIQLVTEKELVDIKIFPKILFDKEVKKNLIFIWDLMVIQKFIFLLDYLRRIFLKTMLKKLIRIRELKSKLSNIIWTRYSYWICKRYNKQSVIWRKRRFC